MQVPFETRDRRQVHRGPERPGAAQTRNPAASPRPGQPPRPRHRGRGLTASQDGRCPAQGPAQGPGSPTRTSQRWRTRSTRASSSSTLLPWTNTLREVGETSTTRPFDHVLRHAPETFPFCSMPGPTRMVTMSERCCSLPQNSIVLPTQTPLGRTLTLSGDSRHRSRPAASPRAAIPAHIVWARLKKVR